MPCLLASGTFSQGTRRGWVSSRSTGGLAACGTSSQRAYPAAAGPASAAAVAVRVQPNVAGWSGMVQRPDVIYVGMGGRPWPGG